MVYNLRVAFLQVGYPSNANDQINLRNLKNHNHNIETEIIITFFLRKKNQRDIKKFKKKKYNDKNK